jgi:hypothetical protein
LTAGARLRTTPDDDAAMRVLPLLQEAGAVPHMRGSLLAHLIGTWSLLMAWDAPSVVRNAGLVHSVYSTSDFKHALFSLRRRPTLQRLIGPEAEALAFLFCVLDRAWLRARLMQLEAIPGRLTVPRHDGQQPLRLSGKTVREILMIECANLADQATGEGGGPAPWMARVGSWLALIGCKRFHLPCVPADLTEPAESMAIASYCAALRLPTRRAVDALNEAVTHNPFAAEPRIMRAVCALERGDPVGALVDASRGRALLTAWSTPWDKRLGFATWQEIASALIGAALEGRRRAKFPMFAAIRKAILR